LIFICVIMLQLRKCWYNFIKYYIHSFFFKYILIIT
jgi:hypothetical protein